MGLSRIVMRLARNPGTEFADGDDHRGYTLHAPLTPDGLLDEAAFKAHRAACVVRRFAPDEDPQEGRLARRGERWFFDYGDDADTAAVLTHVRNSWGNAATPVSSDQVTKLRNAQ